MRHQVSGRKLNRPTNERMSMYRTLAADVLRHGNLTTTEAKAKELRGFVERMITIAKVDNLSSRRRALAFLRDEEVVKKLFSSLGKQYVERKGGYTRLVRIGPRQGDGSEMVKIELV